MTTLDPSHLPWLAHTSDPKSGAAVHTSVRAPLTSRHKVDQIESSDDDTEAEADEQDWLSRARREHRLRRRQDREAARAQGRIPTLPLPDVRFEQSYLMSIQPFIHVSPNASTSASSQEKQEAESEKTPSSSNRDKRRKVEESIALVDDPAEGPSTNAMDAFFIGGKSQAIHIDWDKIVYITFRDQVVSPLVQGALWALGGMLLTSTWSYCRSNYLSRIPVSSVGRGIWYRLFGGPVSIRGKAQNM